MNFDKHIISSIRTASSFHIGDKNHYKATKLGLFSRLANKSKNSIFRTAERLYTIALITVIAILTLPSISQKNYIYFKRLIKTYARLRSAFKKLHQNSLLSIPYL